MNRLSQVIAEIGAPMLSERRDVFVGATAVTLFLLEACAPIVGYPSSTGWLYGATGIAADAVVVWQLVLLLLPQLLAIGVGGTAIWRSVWGRWLSIRVKRTDTLVLPELHLREAAWGLVAGGVVWMLMTLQLGRLPDPRRSLVVAETFTLAVSTVVLVVAIVFRPKRQYLVTETEDQILWMIPQATMPTELVLERTAFLKSLVLQVVRGGYVLVEASVPLRLDAGPHVLLNLGVLEATINVPLHVRSANLLEAQVQLHVSVSAPPRAGVLTAQAVDYLLRNLYTKPDLVELLRHQLGLAMDEYVGDFDSKVKTMEEALGVAMLRTDVSIAGARAAAGTSPLRTVSGPMADLEAMRDRAERRLADLTVFNEEWARARRLQERGKTDLSPVFDSRVKVHFRRQMAGCSPRTWESAVLLLNTARIGILVSAVDFTERAARTEHLLTTVVEQTRADLREATKDFSRERDKYGDELRGVIVRKLDAIDPRLMLTPRGLRLFHELLTMAMAEWDTAIASALPKIREELADLPLEAGTPDRRELTPSKPALRLGRGLSREPAVPLEPPDGDDDDAEPM